MKKLLLTFTASFVCLLLLDSCSKQDDSGGLIDGNGRPRQAPQSTPAAKDTATSDYGIAIDPNGRP